MTAVWPRPGRCGACGREAEQVPSGKWWHIGRPCRARSQAIWRVGDVDIRDAVRFIPAGEPLPAEPAAPHWHETERDADGIPTELAWCRARHMPAIRAWLAREAEEAAS